MDVSAQRAILLAVLLRDKLYNTRSLFFAAWKEKKRENKMQNRTAYIIWIGAN
jgi:hypothetical protein